MNAREAMKQILDNYDPHADTADDALSALSEAGYEVVRLERVELEIGTDMNGREVYLEPDFDLYRKIPEETE